MQDPSSTSPLIGRAGSPAEDRVPEQGGRGNRSRRSFFLFLKIAALLSILGSGAAVGLYAGGGIYPLLDRMIPWAEGIPAVGPRISSFLRKIPGPAPSNQRRLLELQEREAFLDSKEKALEEEKERLEEQKKQKPQISATDTAKKGEDQALSAGGAVETPKTDILEGTLSEMAPSKAARILALMDVSEIGPVFERMDPDWRAQVLGKMPPKDAARFLRYLGGGRPSSLDVPNSQ